MARIHKAAFYLVDFDELITTSELQNLIDETITEYGVTQQLHVETSDPFPPDVDQPEFESNCDLADLERHFDHTPKPIEGQYPVVGALYRHFKGQLVRVIAISKGTEYGETVVVYEHCKDHTIWHRPIEMFTSLVDKEKYPGVKQKYRFEMTV